MTAMLAFLFGCTSLSRPPASVSNDISYTQADNAEASGAVAAPVHWKAVLLAGDDRIQNFDRATASLNDVLAARHVTDRVMLTSDPRLAAAAHRGTATRQNIARALATLRPGAGDGCLLFLTSHGSRQGFVLARDRYDLQPGELAAILDSQCASLPTVVIVSACFSGVFADTPMAAPNRIILTAARADRTSFGCSAEEKYTYYDDCLLRSWAKSTNWQGLYFNVRRCIADKERGADFTPSEPQGFFGASVAGLPLPR
ncbi:MAG TPA: C13 family peptidase [Dongiaceae bacterium]|nr:C13 family peptidase [Dongiaceae bacterium]